VKATPETLAKLQPHPLEVLLARGRDGGGIDADQLQCAEEIVDACGAITRGLGVKAAMLERIGSAGHLEELSPHEERLSAIWFAWATELWQRMGLKPFWVVELIAYIHPLDPYRVSRLERALDLWAKVRHNLARPVRKVSTICPNPLDRGRRVLTGSGT
jgi:hypothetical protein